VEIRPKTGNAFSLEVTAIVGPWKRSAEESRALAAAAAAYCAKQVIVPRAEGQTLVPQELKVPRGAGYYYRATDPRDSLSLNEYRHLCAGAIVLRDFLIVFNFFQHESDEIAFREALLTLSSMELTR